VAGVAHEINNTIKFISAAVPSLYRYLAAVNEILGGFDALERARGTKELENKFDAVKDLKDELEL